MSHQRAPGQLIEIAQQNVVLWLKQNEFLFQKNSIAAVTGRHCVPGWHVQNALEPSKPRLDDQRAGTERTYDRPYAAAKV
jgi:hypothetical protein